MEPFEIMVSESQERMLAVVEPARVDEVLAVCERWQTGAAAIGEVTDARARPRPARRRGRRRDAGRGAGRRLPALRPRAGGARGLDLRRTRRLDARRRRTRRRASDPASILLALLASPSIATKRWAFEQYDSIVGSRTVRRPETADAAVLQLPEAGSAIAVSIDGNGRRVACDPYAGTVEAVLECAQNLACVGAEPLGLTNCLNFGNPEKPHVAWQLDRSTQGARRRLRGARGPGRRRQRLALQRDRGAGRSTRPRSSAWSASCPTRERAGGDRACATATRSPSAGRSRPRSPARSWRSCAASSGRACRRCRSTTSRAAIELVREAVRGGPRRRAPTTSATAASPARSPRWRSPAASAPRSTSTRWSRRAAARARRRCSARGPAASWSPARASALERPGAAAGVDAARSSARAGGERIAISAAEAEVERRARRRRARLALARRAARRRPPRATRNEPAAVARRRGHAAAALIAARSTGRCSGSRC